MLFCDTHFVFLLCNCVTMAQMSLSVNVFIMHIFINHNFFLPPQWYWKQLVYKMCGNIYIPEKNISEYGLTLILIRKKAWMRINTFTAQDGFNWYQLYSCHKKHAFLTIQLKLTNTGLALWCSFSFIFLNLLLHQNEIQYIVIAF